MDKEILYVEDQKILYQNVCKYLRLIGYKVYHFSDGIKALEFAEEKNYRFDLLILDIIVPRKNGLEILDQVRQNNALVPAMLITSLGDTASIVKGLGYGADDYIVKPFAMAELRARIQAVLRRPIIKTKSVVKVGDLEVNSYLRQASYKGKELGLRPKEFKLLQFLMANNNQTLTREYIMMNVWGEEEKASLGNVDVQIRGIRKKIGANGSHVIETIHGFGYRLNA